MECAICLNNIVTSCIGSCNHHFCAECLVQWCKSNNVCPKCKYVIKEIKSDPEFDAISSELLKKLLNGDRNDSVSLLGSETYSYTYSYSSGLQSRLTREIIIDFPQNSNTGITLRNCDGPGVKITKLDYNGRARICGLCVGNVIFSINNVPCINHKQTIAIFDECMFSNKDVRCIVRGG